MSEDPKSSTRPLVSILMAVYHPDDEWLARQLASLNRQTYDNLELIVCDDGPDRPAGSDVIHRYISRFSVAYVVNTRNMGSNWTFERLTAMAAGTYVAYCDQDDIWEEDKIDRLVRRLEETGALLCFSDLSVIDSDGNKIASSLTQIRKRHRFSEGTDVASKLIVRNFVVGCAMIMETRIAQAAIPFAKEMVHDHWLALYAASRGRISFERAATVRYRQHGANQTGVLAGVESKEEYYRLRIDRLCRRLEFLSQRMSGDEMLLPVINEAVAWAHARRRYFIRPSIKEAKIMWLGRAFDPYAVVFELAMARLPSRIFSRIIKTLKQ